MKNEIYDSQLRSTSQCATEFVSPSEDSFGVIEQPVLGGCAVETWGKAVDASSVCTEVWALVMRLIDPIPSQPVDAPLAVQGSIYDNGKTWTFRLSNGQVVPGACIGSDNKLVVWLKCEGMEYFMQFAMQFTGVATGSGSGCHCGSGAVAFTSQSESLLAPLPRFLEVTDRSAGDGSSSAVVLKYDPILSSKKKALWSSPAGESALRWLLEVQEVNNRLLGRLTSARQGECCPQVWLQNDLSLWQTSRFVPDASQGDSSNSLEVRPQ